MRRSRLQFVEDRIPDAPRITPQAGIPKPQRLDAARLQKLFPRRVMFALVGETMLAAVQFHIQFRLLAKEIEIVNAERMLASEFVAGERLLVDSQHAPAVKNRTIRRSESNERGDGDEQR